ncbi:hypothetical protein GPS63_04550 [Acinetobacter haemolyticus]|uniref:hypothetical protein n=1 Tax=Acinetobacter haemolyticus TaxID=29430 RepID=UPI001331F54B|nr:hypothetical protein [Acinetobacter haemolyticus]NAR17583.1 hypothetical protein [Acinetobacter haemolyticus]NAR37255.1 hypothetical protein [Acinetobacter haemolyticus]NAR49066.1 hypothetical protein [Acinetobacter haemolyticus]QHI18518.1 hypothetical protein AhaeAN3_00355 [Acinetobacter haemolyticus]
MISWMKFNCILIISIVANTMSWAEPASVKKMHALDDSELSKVTDHDHADKISHSHTHELGPNNKEAPQNLTKDNNLQKLIDQPKPTK